MAIKPNILFILIDDLGWRDLNCYGSTFHETPHLDRLAAEGMRFTDAYAACPVCSPTRASLLTGKYPATLGITDWIDWRGQWHPLRGRVVEAPYLKGLPASEVTVAQALREGGYRTWHVGKWHLGGPGSYPTECGFDVNLGGCEWGMPQNGYFSPWGIPGMADAPEGTYLTDHLTDAAIELIRQPDERPFFLHLSHYAVHTPIQAPPALVAKYETKAKRLGLDRVQAVCDGEHFHTERMRDSVVKHRIMQSNPAYAAMMENLDSNIGRVLAALEETGQVENTLVIFTSDNGGLATGGHWASECAPTCNLPLQAGKGWMYEGGTREPYIVRWPGRVTPGALCRSPITSPDLYPTLLEVAGLPPRPEQHVDGVSFRPLLEGDAAFDRGPVFWHYPHYGNQGGTPGSSIRHGAWKLIEFLEDGCLELYHLATDISETTDVAAAHPEVVRELHEELVAWRARAGAKLPEPNPKWRPLGRSKAATARSAAAARTSDLPVPLVNWALDELFRVPVTFPAPGFVGEGVQPLFYQSVPYRGCPTRVFAWLGLPQREGAAPYPGVVLLHGGGGTAFDEWVRLWNARGYAAIAMDLCGCVPEHPQSLDGKPHPRHQDAGPPGWGASFDQTDAAVEDQWTYHAVAAAVAGHSLLAAQPGVDPRRIAVTGISWGGYLASIVAGVDSRLRAAAPVYGCGFLGHDSIWQDIDFPNRPPEQVQRWLDLWDPSRYLAQAEMAMCWVSGTNDFAYPLPSLQKSYLLSTGPRTLCIRVDMPHSHRDGWAPAEIGIFMDSVLDDGTPLPKLCECGHNGEEVWAVFAAAKPIAKAELCTTRALGQWTDRRWTVSTARFDAATGRAEATLPPHTTAWFLNLFDDRGCVASTPHQENGEGGDVHGCQ